VKTTTYTAAAAVFLSLALSADAIRAKPFAYREGFEDTMPAASFWATNGENAVNYMGVTDEKACAGKKSLKLDVTITSGSYHYFGLTMKVPCEGKLRMSARLWLGEGTDAQVGFGANFNVPPTVHSGCRAVQTWTGATGAWKLVECDLVGDGGKGKAEVLARHAPGVKPEDAGVVLDKWSIFICGRPGQRAVIYLDDITISGTAPAYGDYENELAFRWEQPKIRELLRLDKLRNRITAGDSALAPFAVQPEAASLRLSAASALGLIEQCTKKGYCDAAEEEAIQGALSALAAAPEKCALLADARAEQKPFLCFTPPAISDSLWPDNAFPFAAPSGDTLRASACRGEYEPFTALLYALVPAQPLEVEVSALTMKKESVPADSVGIRVVKCWFKATGRVNDPSTVGYFPELLVRDDSLVLVDAAGRENRVRSTAPDGAKKYLVAGAKAGDGFAGVRPLDADRFCPVAMPRNSLRQFWFTLHAPDSAKAGVYKGKVTFRARGAKLAVPVAVTIHPFTLQPAGLAYSVFYRSALTPDMRPQISSEVKSEEQYRADMADLLAHGVTFPTSYQPYNERMLTKVLQIRSESGLPAGLFFNLGAGTGSDTAAAALMLLSRRVGQWVDYLKSFGYDRVYFYGADEAAGERLAGQRRAWKAVQDAGGKTFVACGPDAYDSMGTLLDCPVLSGKPDPAQARQWRGIGARVFCYGYPQAGEIKPETFRRHYGLELWKAGFDGAMCYAYQHGSGHIWNDFDGQDLCFTYPAAIGVVGTLQWEGFREAIDDVRYMTTLEKAVVAVTAKKKSIADRALAWLHAVDPEKADPSATREKMAEWIVNLTNY
jgi:hypothetical protein